MAKKPPYKPVNPGSYLGNQVIINSDRLLFNAKTDSILLFSDIATKPVKPIKKTIGKIIKKERIKLVFKT